MKNNFLVAVTIILGFATILMSSCSKDDENDENNNNITNVQDVDGNTYNTVKIGTQVWMVENLNTTKYSNGDFIPTGISSANTSGAYENYDGNATYADTYGKLYNWHAVSDPRGLCPDGWHIPSDEEWKTLEIYIGMSPEEAEETEGERGTDEGGKLKATGTDYWISPNTGATNEYGFTALPGGALEIDAFVAIGQNGFWWTSTPASDDNSMYRYMHYNSPIINRKSFYKSSGLSVRCIQDN
ncbi:MAG TPA: fibrobacter succinogenes major paralogous domain-containing protein [Tenuifilaceae bacterium]|nr:fibrobacter succinogenes major paralogous domain-containing protein [Tenuifilaceae bacterium]